MNSAFASQLVAHIEAAAFLAPGELSPDAPLFSSGIIDSLNLIEIVAFVEGLCGFKVPAEDLRLEHWDSVDRILAYASRRNGV